MKNLVPILFLILLFTKIGAQPQLIVKGLQFTEGPAIDKNGELYFSDVRAQKIYHYSKDEELNVFIDNTGGANGLYFDKTGNLIACAGKARRIISISPEKEVKTIASEFENKKLNSPNDLWIDSKGGIYFTDPRYGSTDDLEQGGMHVYYITPEKKLIRVTNDLLRPNGIIGIPNGKVLYIVDQGVEKTYRYKILPDGLLANKELFAAVGTDGMSIDSDGNVYITHQKGVEIFSAKGKKAKTLLFDALTTNVVFDNKVLYVTTQSGEVYRVCL